MPRCQTIIGCLLLWLAIHTTGGVSIPSMLAAPSLSGSHTRVKSEESSIDGKGNKKKHFDKKSALTELNELTKRASISEARALLKELLHTYPNDSAVHLAAADLYAAIGSSGAAIDEYKKALADEPNYTLNKAKAHTALAQIYLANGNASEAVGEAHRALALAPDAEQAQLVLVNALLKIGELREAENVLQKILGGGHEPRAESADLDYTAYQLYRKRRQFFIAQNYLAKAMALQPQQYQWLLDKADICESVGDYQKAERALEKLLAVDPYSIEALYKLGVLLEFYRHDYDRATVIYQELVQIDPDYVAALTGLDRCKSKKNDIAGQLKLVLWRKLENFRQALIPTRNI